MTRQNDGVDIQIEIMIRQDLSFAEKMVYGIIKTHELEKKSFIYPDTVGTKLGIKTSKAFFIIRSLKRKGLI